jgi:hypothetical protein
VGYDNVTGALGIRNYAGNTLVGVKMATPRVLVPGKRFISQKKDYLPVPEL